MAKREGFGIGLMKRGFLFALIALTLLPSFAQSEVFYTDLFITIKDINSGDTIISMPIDIVWMRTDADTTINLTRYLDKRGTFSYRISPGKWVLKIYVDNRSTPEMDYYGESPYTITGEEVTKGETLYVDPIGSAEMVVSDIDGKLISGADIDFKCKSYRETAKTDRFGSYKADNLPAGECRVSAAFADLVGTKTIKIVQGNFMTDEVRLNEPVLIPPFGAYTYYLIGAALAVVIFLIIYFRLMRKRIKREVRKEIDKRARKRPAKAAKEHKEKGKKEGQKPEAHGKPDAAAEESKEELNPRARDIMKTLNDKEQSIVNFLIASNNKSTQAGIRNETGIPKTTLARLFQALEAKKVIRVETIGKLKKIELTDWFLGKE